MDFFFFQLQMVRYGRRVSELVAITIQVSDSLLDHPPVAVEGGTIFVCKDMTPHFRLFKLIVFSSFLFVRMYRSLPLCFYLILIPASYILFPFPLSLLLFYVSKHDQIHQISHNFYQKKLLTFPMNAIVA